MKKVYIWLFSLTMLLVMLTGCTQTTPKSAEMNFSIEIEDSRGEKYTLSSSDLYYRFYDNAQKSGILVYSWENASEINPNFLLNFFSAQSNWTQVTDDSVIVHLPQEIVENYLKEYFYIESPEEIRQSMWYQPEEEAYELALYPWEVPSIITNATAEDNILTIYYEKYTTFIEGNPVENQGYVTIEIEKYPTHWKFISNKVTYQGKRYKEIE